MAPTHVYEVATIEQMFNLQPAAPIGAAPAVITKPTTINRKYVLIGLGVIGVVAWRVYAVNQRKNEESSNKLQPFKK